MLVSYPCIKLLWYVSLGKYGQDESLLHLCIRQKLEGAASYLLQNVKGRETFLQQKDYKGKTPTDIARKQSEKRIVDMLERAIVSCINNSTQYILHIIIFSNRKNILKDQQPQVC